MLLSGNGSRTIDHMGIHGEVPRCRHCGANHRIGKLLFLLLSTFLGLCILTPLDRENRLAASNLMGVPISLAGNLLLDARFGATGAAISMLVAEIVICTMQIALLLGRALQVSKLGATMPYGRLPRVLVRDPVDVAI